jgi:hypothetical protein
LTGGVPSELGNMTVLADLYIDHNPLSGSLPVVLDKLKLYYFYFNNTNLCKPNNPEFLTWLGKILNMRGTDEICGSQTPYKIFLPAVVR